jgi:hypothetical protein
MKKGEWYKHKDWANRAKLRIFEEYYRQKYTEQAVRQMINNNNSYLEMDVVRNAITDVQKRIEFVSKVNRKCKS